MSAINLKAPAKINWTLDVVGTYPNGYHKLDMVMQSIALYDDIIISERRDFGIQLTIDTYDIPHDESNIAYKAALLIRDRFNIKKGININIKKNIPIAAGLAGGSTDAAAVLVGLNQLWDINIDSSQLREIGLILGADVPFCVLGGAAHARGVGERLNQIISGARIYMILIKPEYGVSTKDIFEKFDMKKVTRRPNSSNMINAITRGNINDIGKEMVNVLESVTTQMHPDLLKIKYDLHKEGAAGVLMTGSGPTVYGVFQNEVAAEKAFSSLYSKYSQVYITHTLDDGIKILGG